MYTAISDPDSAQRTLIVNKRILEQPAPDLGGEINWEVELAKFKKLEYPEYYLQPFHSVPGGWLSKAASTINRQAMQAIYADTHPESCLGVRKDLAQLVAAGKTGEGTTVVDFGCGDGDGAAAVARAFPKARVIGVDASPFMIIVGSRQNRDATNLEWLHTMAEHTGLASNSVDAVQIQLVLHECSDEARLEIGKEACRILKPGGQYIITDTPQDDLGHYRGFLEPHKDTWQKFSVATYFGATGFNYDGNHLTTGPEEADYSGDGGTFNRTYTWIGTKQMPSRL
jgi:SAM-dependent methyltransferase